ncbi:MAG: phosphate ABC transporter substrate-binding protein [Deltaproteobacteria bacterium]|nr:phosphate ABC transporter substrate-binding protein [Deltaproteobacteria bacterium]
MEGCRRPQEGETLVVTGSSTLAPLILQIGRRYEERHPGVRIDVQTGGSARGITDARTGVASAGMVSRRLGAGEADLTAHLVARDGIGLIVHGENPVTSLTREQVVGIFTGRLTNWQAVGGRAAPITVVNKAEGRSTLELFVHHFGLENAAIKADVVIGDNEQGVKTVAGNPAAIGYVSIGTAETDIAGGVPIRLLPMDGVVANTAQVAAGKYPLSRELNLVTRGAPTGALAAFIAYAQGREVVDLVGEHAFVPVR